MRSLKKEKVYINAKHLGSIMPVIECSLGRDASITMLKKMPKIGSSHATQGLLIVLVRFTPQLSFRLRCFFLPFIKLRLIATVSYTCVSNVRNDQTA